MLAGRSCGQRRKPGTEQVLFDHYARYDGSLLGEQRLTAAEHDYPGAKAMLFAAGVPDDSAMESAPHLGIASVWWEGNPCK